MRVCFNIEPASRLIGAVILATAIAWPLQPAVADTMRVKSGTPKRVFSIWNCFNKVTDSGAVGRASHGTVTVQKALEDRCQGRHPVEQFWYVPEPSYRGPDEVFIFWQGSALRQKIIVE